METTEHPETHDFGEGPVPAHRHINPDGSTGGWVANTAYVADTAHVGHYATVSGISILLGRAMAFDHSQVRDATIMTGFSAVCGQAVVAGNSTLSGTARVLAGASLNGSQVDSGIVKGWVQLGSQVVVGPKGYIYGVGTISGPCRINQELELG
jgi:hypothetical protein